MTAFYESLFSKFHALPKARAVARVKEAAVLEDLSPEEAAKAYLVAREAWAAQDPARKAVDLLEGTLMHSSEANLVEDVLSGGGKVYLALQEDKLVYRADPPAGQLTPLRAVRSKKRAHYIYSFKGKDLEQPLSRFLKDRFPESVAAGILTKPKRSSKSVVGPWEAIQRDPKLKELFSRRKKEEKRTNSHAA